MTKTNKDRILILASTFPRWENDTEPPFVFLLCKHLQKLRYNITVLAPHFPGAKMHERMDGIEIYRFPYFFPFGLQKLCYEGGMLTNMRKSFLAKLQVPLFFISQSIFLIFLLLYKSPALVHAHWIVPQGLTAGIVKFLFRFKLLVSVHGSDITAFQKGIKQRLAKFALARADYVTANSSVTYSILQHMEKNIPSGIVPMGIEISKFSPSRKTKKIKELSKTDGPLLLCVGRLVELKGIRYAIEAMPEILQAHPSAKLLIIGSGPEKASLEKLCEKMRLENKVLFLGKIPNSTLPEYYASSDIFIGPSIETADGATEAFGVVFLEALASGTAVITTEVGGISDIVKHGYTGLTIPTHDSAAVAKAVVKLLANENLKETIKQNGLSMVQKKFSWATVANQFCSIYNNL